MNKNNTKIICGFAGIGKSSLARNRAGVVDLESTPFEKDWDRYTKVAKHMADNGYTVLVSCHKELRQAFQEKGIPYILALPPKEKRIEYIKRYKERGNDEAFVKMMNQNWEKFLEVYTGENDVLIVKEFLQDAVI